MTQVRLVLLFAIGCQGELEIQRQRRDAGRDTPHAAGDSGSLDGSVDTSAEHEPGEADAGDVRDAGAGDAAAVEPPGELPASCALLNRGRGLCVDAWVNVAAFEWTFLDAVVAAVDALDRGDEALFDPDGTVPPEKRPAFADAISALLDADGVCARWNGEELYVRSAERDYNETLLLKRDASMSQDFDVDPGHLVRRRSRRRVPSGATRG